jgi:hypothetical protein
MHSPMREERRRSPRRCLFRVAKIKTGPGIPPRDCLLIDISDGGVRLFLDGFDALMNLCCSCPVTVSFGKAHTRWSGGAVMKLARSSSGSSDPALLCRLG